MTEPPIPLLPDPEGLEIRMVQNIDGAYRFRHAGRRGHGERHLATTAQRPTADEVYAWFGEQGFFERVAYLRRQRRCPHHLVNRLRPAPRDLLREAGELFCHGWVGVQLIGSIAGWHANDRPLGAAPGVRCQICGRVTSFVSYGSAVPVLGVFAPGLLKKWR